MTGLLEHHAAWAFEAAIIATAFGVIAKFDIDPRTALPGRDLVVPRPASCFRVLRAFQGI